MLSRRSAPVWAAAAISVCTPRACQFWDGGWVKKNDQAAEPQGPRGGCGPAAAAGRFKATYDFQLFFRIDAQGRGCTPDRCVRGCILTIVAYRRIDESRAIRITRSRGIPSIQYFTVVFIANTTNHIAILESDFVLGFCRMSICKISDAELQAIFFRQAAPAWLSSTSQMLNCGKIVAMASSSR